MKIFIKNTFHNVDDFAVVGDVYGYADLKKILGKDELLDILRENRLSIKKLCQIMSKSVGDFYLFTFIKNSLYVISSTATSGLFYKYNDELILSDNERYIYSLSKIKNLDGFQVFEFLSTRVRSQPFYTFFKDVSHIPPGSILEFNKKSKRINFDLFVLKKGVNFKRNYKNFKTIFDNSLNAFVRGNNKKTYIMFSGGVDSTVLLFGLLKHNFYPEPIYFHRPSNKLLNNLIELVSHRIGFEFKTISPPEKNFKETLRFVEDQMITQRDGGWNNYYFKCLCNYAGKENEYPVLICGHNGDAVYNIRSDDVFHFTNFYFKLLNQQKKYRYLKGLLYHGWGTEVENPFWYEEKNIFNSRSLQNYYLNEKYNRFYSNMPDHKDFDFNHFVRVVSYLKWSNNVRPTFVNYYYFYKVNLPTPFNFGPICNFFLNMRLNLLIDGIFPKRFSYKYFKDFFGLSYGLCQKKADPLYFKNFYKILIID